MVTERGCLCVTTEIKTTDNARHSVFQLHLPRLRKKIEEMDDGGETVGVRYIYKTYTQKHRHSGGSIKLVSGQPDGLWYRWKNKWFYDVQQHTTDFPKYIRREKYLYIYTNPSLCFD